MPVPMGGEGLGQVAQQVALLLPRCLRDAQQPLRGSQSGAALAAEAELAPDDWSTQRLLRAVVRRLDAFESQKGPQRRPQPQQIPTQRACGLWPRRLQPVSSAQASALLRTAARISW
jgi:hypothetical protein